MADEKLEQNEGVIDDSTNDNDTKDEELNEVQIREQSIARIDAIMHPKNDSEESEDDEDKQDEEDVKDEDTASEDLESEDNTESDDDSKDTEYEEVNPSIATPFIQTALQNGWSKERIRNYATTHTDEDLLFMTKFLGGEKVADKKLDKDEKQTFSLDESLLDKLDLGDESKGALKDLLSPLVNQLNERGKKIDELESKLDSRQEKDEQSDNIRQFNIASEMFDTVSEELPSLGKTDSMPSYPDGSLIESSPEVKLRNKLYQTAQVLYNSGAYSFKDAMNIAINSYKGSEGVKEYKNSVIKNVKKNEQKLSAKGAQKQTTVKYTDERERKAAIVNNALHKHNVHLPR